MTDKVTNLKVYSDLADNLLLKMGNVLGHVKKHSSGGTKALMFFGKLVGKLPGVDSLEERVRKPVREGFNKLLFAARSSHDFIVSKAVKGARNAFKQDDSNKLDPNKIFETIISDPLVKDPRIEQINVLIQQMKEDNKTPSLSKIKILYAQLFDQYKSEEFSKKIKAFKSKKIDEIVLLAKEMHHIRSRAVKMIKELKEKFKELSNDLVDHVKDLKVVLKGYENELLAVTIDKQHNQLAQLCYFMLYNEKVTPTTQALKSVNDDITNKLFFRHKYVNMNLLCKVFESTLSKMQSTVQANPSLQNRVEFVTV